MRTRIPTVVTGFPAYAKSITPNDSTPLTDFNGQPRAQTVYVGSAGTVSVIPVGNDISQPVSFACPAGGLVPVEVKYVRSTGTSAGGLIGLF